MTTHAAHSASVQPVVMRWRALLTMTLICSWPTALDAADAPLRHMVFSYDCGITSLFEQQTSGLQTINSNQGGSSMIGVSGSAIQRSNSSTVDRGTIVADVLRATADGGLVIETSDSGRERRWPATKVGIREDGALLVAKGADLSEEQRQLLVFLARGLLDGAPQVGQVWRTEEPATKNTGDVTTYTITAIEDPVAHITVDRVAFDHGLRSFDLHLTGTVDYNWRKSVPNSAKIRSVLHSERAEGLTTVTTDITLALVEDSFRH